MNSWLTPEEVERLTDSKRRDTQCQRLAEMGIPFRPTYVGRPLVERSAVLSTKERVERTPVQPNWDALGP